ncbi:MAG: hypothetical protein O3C09_04550, partial [Proteobacteria bacterium]|nr:hypothetical protein [Pseudomonadota bacterium]
FDEMFGQLRDDEGQRLVGEFYENLMSDVNVQRFNFDGTPAGDAGPLLAPPPQQPVEPAPAP